VLGWSLPPAPSLESYLGGVVNKQHPRCTNLVHWQHISAPIWCMGEVSTHSLPGRTNVVHWYVAPHQVSRRSHCQRTNVVHCVSEYLLTWPAHQSGASSECILTVCQCTNLVQCVRERAVGFTPSGLPYPSCTRCINTTHRVTTY